MKTVYAWGVLALVLLAGCGGGGSAENAATQWARQYIGEIADQDTAGLSALVSNSYLNSCQNKTQFLSEFQAIFDGATSVTISFDVDSSSVNGSAGTAEVFGTLQISATGPAGYNYSFNGLRRFQLIREAGVWRLYGNQSCP